MKLVEEFMEIGDEITVSQLSQSDELSEANQLYLQMETNCCRGAQDYSFYRRQI